MMKKDDEFLPDWGSDLAGIQPAHQLGEAEIRDLSVVQIIQQNVLGLDVQVHNPLLTVVVQVSQSFGRSHCDVEPSGPVEEPCGRGVVHEQPLVQGAV
jgi:hypothetical protein